ncbi:hypothetical protein EUGRSUZ_I01916 [Eucalyptus grandis]|uniref:Uncharacterized protein n=2 Tax=Eucalyptus grandis TaxID=71139 RepID=A0A059AQW6_EUCGR|nr:hypothetical protein EUGRSUZ_I01916 [Eucalyptus grandis]
MAHTNAQRRQRLPVSSSDTGVDNRGGGGDDHSGLPCSIPLAFLTINSVNTIYRASVNGDTPMVVFIVFVYLAYLLLDYCLTELNRSPPTDRGPRRTALKLVAWVFTTAIGFGFAYHFSQLTGACMAVAFHALAATTSGVVFYTYFYCDHGDCGRGNGCKVEKIDVKFVFGRAKTASATAKSAGDVPDAAENV